MWKDEIVEEIHRYREQYAARFNYDIHAIFADLKRKQEQSGREYVSFASPHKEILPATTANDEKKAA